MLPADPLSQSKEESFSGESLKEDEGKKQPTWKRRWS